MESMKEVIAFLQEKLPDRVILSNPKHKNIPYRKITITKKMMKNVPVYQAEKYTITQAFHENFPRDNLENKLTEFLEEYRQIDAFCPDIVYTIKVSKNGKIFIGEGKPQKAKFSDENLHNRKKQYRLQENTIIEPLIDLGVFTKEGKVVNSMYDKYKQINRFIEMVEDVLPDHKERFTVIDFGCGKSYLTFVLYYYLVKIRGMNAHIMGLDLKKDVIEKCNQTAKKYGYDGLEFFEGDIAHFSFDGKVDMVMTLHACDTATDYALYHAIRWNSELILSVPCCQHELNGQMESDELSIITKYGIIKERMAALMTDAVRASLLEVMGYKTQVLEFIDIEHSPKNLLIRAKRSNISKEKKEASLAQVKRLMDQFSINPSLYTLLIENHRINS